MDIIYFLIPLSLLLLAGGIWAFLWAINSGQFDDLDGAAWRVVFDDKDREAKRKKSHDA